MAYHQREVRSTRDWSSLPPKSLATIRKLIESSIDAFQFRSVCKNWRFSTTPNYNHSLISPILPCKISNPTFPFLNHLHNNDTPLILVSRAVFSVQPYELDTSSWLLTVEESTPGKLKILFPLSNEYVTTLPSSFPKYLDLSEYYVSEISKSCKLKYANGGTDVSGVKKVVLCSNFTAIVLYGRGTVVGVNLKTGKWDYLRYSLVTSIFDVVICKGIVFVVDCIGGCHSIDHNSLSLTKTFADNLSEFKSFSKSLVVDEGELFLGALRYDRNSVDGFKFTFYHMDKQQCKWVQSNCVNGILFVSVDCCFFAFTRASCLCDSVVCSKDYMDSIGKAFAVELLFENSSVDLQIGHIDRKLIGGLFLSPKLNRVEIAEVLWPPPAWFWTVSYSSTGDDEAKDELEFSNKDFRVHSQEVLQPMSLVIDSSSGAAAVSIGQDLVPKNNRITMDSVVKVQNSNSFTSTTMFEGVKIQSNLVPALQTIWAKQGDILEQSRIRNGDLLAKALESLATTFHILKNTSGHSLTNIQAEYLSSTLCDLQHMHFKVDWLTPFVEKALAVYKSKPLVNSLKEFSEAKTRAQEMKLKVLDELAKLDEAEEDMKFIFDKIPVLETVDLDQSLGQGLC